MSGRSTIQITVNGEVHAVPGETTVAQLLAQLEFPPRGIAVEVNGDLIPFERHADLGLRQDDQIEVATLAGGG